VDFGRLARNVREFYKIAVAECLGDAFLSGFEAFRNLREWPALHLQ
jgi:hypothetical protein